MVRNGVAWVMGHSCSASVPEGDDDKLVEDEEEDEDVPNDSECRLWMHSSSNSDDEEPCGAAAAMDAVAGDRPVGGKKEKRSPSIYDSPPRPTP